MKILHPWGAGIGWQSDVVAHGMPFGPQQLARMVYSQTVFAVSMSLFIKLLPLPKNTAKLTIHACSRCQTSRRNGWSRMKADSWLPLWIGSSWGLRKFGIRFWSFPWVFWGCGLVCRGFQTIRLHGVSLIYFLHVCELSRQSLAPLASSSRRCSGIAFPV